MKKLLFSLAVLAGISATAQVKVGDNPTTINSSALLEMESTTKGLLLPRVALVATNDFAPLAAHVAGMKVYNTATAGTVPNNVTPGEYYNDGAKWIKIGDAAAASKWTNDAANTRVALTNLSDGTTARPSGTEFVIMDKGRVGIGTNTPSTTLDIKPKLSSQLTGTFSYVLNDNFITGVGTNFDEYFEVGDNLHMLGNLEYPVTITSVSATEITFEPAENFSNTSGGTFSDRPAYFLSKQPALNVENTDIKLKNLHSIDGQIFITKYDDLNWSAPSILGRKYTGDINNPQPVKANHPLFGIYASGGTAPDRTSVNVGSVRIMAAADFDTNYSQPNSTTNPYSHPTYIDFAVTNHRATGRSEAMRIAPGGNVGIGQSNPAAVLHVSRTGAAGTISSSGTSVTGVSTNFTTAFRRNERFTANGETRVIVDIVSPTQLVIDTPFTSDLPAGTVYRASYRSSFSGDMLINGLTVGTGGGNFQSVAMGNLALHSGQSALLNVAIGNESMRMTTTGNRNVAVGDNTLRNSTTAFENTAVGARALVNLTTSSRNVAIGRSALEDLLTGEKNIAIGHSAGLGITTGNNNVIIGSVTGLPSDLSNAIILANNTNRKMYINEAGYTVFGTGSSLLPGVTPNGHGQTSEPRFHILDDRTIGSSQEVLRLERYGNADITHETEGRIGLYLNDNNATGGEVARISWANSSNISSGPESQGDLHFWTSEISNAVDDALPLKRMTIRYNGDVGIGTTTPATKLDVAGTIKIGDSNDSTPQKGMIRFNSTTNKFQGQIGVGQLGADANGWVDLH